MKHKKLIMMTLKKKGKIKRDVELKIENFQLQDSRKSGNVNRQQNLETKLLPGGLLDLANPFGEESVFNEEVDSLAFYLAEVFPPGVNEEWKHIYTKSEWSGRLRKARTDKIKLTAKITVNTINNNSGIISTMGTVLNITNIIELKLLKVLIDFVDLQL